MCGPAKRCRLGADSTHPGGISMRRASAAVPDLVPVLSRGRHRNPAQGRLLHGDGVLPGRGALERPPALHPPAARGCGAHGQRPHVRPAAVAVDGADPVRDRVDDARPAGRRAHRPVLRHGGAAGRLRRAPAGDGGVRPVGRASAGDAGAPSPRRPPPGQRRRPSPAPRSPPRGRGRSSAASAGRSTSSAATARRTSCASPCRGSPRPASPTRTSGSTTCSPP